MEGSGVRGPFPSHLTSDFAVLYAGSLNDFFQHQKIVYVNQALE